MPIEIIQYMPIEKRTDVIKNMKKSENKKEL